MGKGSPVGHHRNMPPRRFNHHHRQRMRNQNTGVPQGACLGLVLFLLCVNGAAGGSRLIEPPARQSLWRYGHGTPVNFYDDDVNCGGFNTHHVTNNGQCGVCGDPWNSPRPRDHEAGGKVSPNPLPVRAYKMGGFVPVAVDSTADLLGKYEFRLCKLNSSTDTPDQTCFDETPLTIRESEFGQSYQIGQSGGLVSLHLQLPPSLVCSHCILQWRHVTGYRTNRQECVQCGTEPPKCTFCKGCGAQEWYQGCVDIAVYDTAGTHPALAGVQTHEELKQQWEATLASYKNCTSANSVGTSPDASGTSSGANDNTINSTYPWIESPSSSVPGGPNVPVVTAGPATVPNNGEVASTTLGVTEPALPSGTDSNADHVSSGQSGTDTSTNNNMNTNNNNNENTINNSNTNSGSNSNTDSQTAFPNTSGNNANSGGQYHPIFNPAWTGNYRPQWTSPICYIPYRAPAFLFNAREWCINNCPQRQNLCRYSICRPVSCGQITPTRTPQARFSWLLPFLFTESFELR